MATLTGQSIASSYEQLLHVDTDGGGNTTTLVPIKDGDNGTTFCLQLSTTKAMIEGSGSKLFFSDEGGEYISGDGTDLTLTSGNDIVLTATSVGIGQSTPASPNSVAKFLHIGSSGDAHSSIVMEDNANTWELMSNDGFSIFDGTSEYLTILNTGNVGIGDSDPSEAKLSITGVASGDAGIKIDQDQNNYALEIDSEATTAASIYIAGNTATTTPIIMVDDADALTTGNILKLYSNSSDNSVRKLVYIINDHGATDNTTGLHIQQDGNGSAIEISGVGNGGIKFSGGASTDANTLDDYEEGTWNPTWVTSGDASAVFTYQSDTGAYYTKIGRMVYISGSIRTDTITANTDSGSLSIGSLPFTTGARTDGDNADDVINCFSSGNFDANEYPEKGVINRESTTFGLYYSTASGAGLSSSQFEDLHISAMCRTYFSGHYRV